jgi:hypothetical protein
VGNMSDWNKSGKIECKPQLASKMLGLGIISFLTAFLVLMTMLSYFMPDSMGIGITQSLPFWWLLWIYGFLSFFLTPNVIIISNLGIEVRCIQWQQFLNWQDIDKVKIYKYQTFVYSNSLPMFTYLIGASLFGFRRSFALNWRYTNYDKALHLMRKNLTGKIEQY